MTKSRPKKKSNNTVLFTVIAAGILIVLGVIVYLYYINTTKESNPTSKSTSSATTQQKSSSESSANPQLIIGNPNAKVTLVEYGDFKCPLCTKFSQTTENQIKKEYIDSGKVKIEYRVLPIIAEDSKTAGAGAYCANEQGKFTNYHDALFKYMWETYYKNGNYSAENTTIFTPQKLSEISSSAGLDGNNLSACIKAGTFAASVDADEQAAKQAGVSSTPTFFIGKQKVSGAQPYAIFKPLIDAQLK